LTGRPPFGGDDVGEVLRRGETGGFPPPPPPGPPPAPALEGACLQATATKPPDPPPPPQAPAGPGARRVADEPRPAPHQPRGGPGAAGAADTTVGAAEPVDGHRRGGGALGRADRPGRRGGRAGPIQPQAVQGQRRHQESPDRDAAGSGPDRGRPEPLGSEPAP